MWSADLKNLILLSYMRLPASLEEDGAECGIERAPTERKRETAVIEEVGDGTY